MQKILASLFAILLAAGCDNNTNTQPISLIQSGPDKPEFVRLSWNDDPSTTAAIVWHTEKEVGGAAVEYGATTSYGKSVLAESYQIEGFDGWYHKAKVTGLTPNATVHYRVGSRTGLSEDFVFQTAPAGSSTDPIVFVVQGDSRAAEHGVGPAYAKLSAQLDKEAPAFILDSGDYTNLSLPDEWVLWQKDGEPINPTTPRLTTFGNHEMIVENYFELVSLPEENEEKWYSLDYGPIHIICLYTGFGDTDSRTAEWLKQDLAASKAKWKIAFFHMPPYNAGNHDDEEVMPVIRAEWVPLFEQYGVDVVAAGHDHNYQNFGFLKGGQPHGDRELPIVGDGTAPLYIVSGGAGAPLYEVKPTTADYPLIVKTEAIENYVLVTVAGGKMTLEVKRLDGTVIDTIEINK